MNTNGEGRAMRVVAMVVALVLGAGCVAEVEETGGQEPAPFEACSCDDAGEPPADHVWGCDLGTSECVAIACADWPARCAPMFGVACQVEPTITYTCSPDEPVGQLLRFGDGLTCRPGEGAPEPCELGAECWAGGYVGTCVAVD